MLINSVPAGVRLGEGGGKPAGPAEEIRDPEGGDGQLWVGVFN